MFIDSININVLRIFERVYSLRSMTLAADELHLTQSGVSQHINNLESALDVKLFDRFKRQIIPTEKAHELYKVCSVSFLQIEEQIWKIKETKKDLSGTVVIGMPAEFGHNVVQPLLAKFSKQHPNIIFKLQLEFAPIMNQMLIDGRVDFAFVDEYSLDPRVHAEKVYDEVLDLCISSAALKKFGPPQMTREYFEALEYVEYFDGEPVLRSWFNNQFKIKNINLKIRAYVANPQIVARIICADMAAGILPDHLYQQLIKDGHKIQCLEGSSAKPVVNTIKIAYLKQRTFSPAVTEVRHYLVENINNLK